MNNKAILISLVAIAMQSISFGQDAMAKQFSGTPKPGWWFALKRSDLCVKASLVKVDEAHKERLLDGNNNIIAEYFPVEMRIDQILFASPKMAFDGRFLKEPGSEYKVNPKSVGGLGIYYVKVVSGSIQSVVDSHLIGSHPQLPATGIFLLEMSSHKKGAEFLITSCSGIEMEEEYRKAISE